MAEAERILPELMTPQQLADELDCSTDILYPLFSHPGFPAFKISPNKWAINVEALRELANDPEVWEANALPGLECDDGE